MYYDLARCKTPNQFEELLNKAVNATHLHSQLMINKPFSDRMEEDHVRGCSDLYLFQMLHNGIDQDYGNRMLIYSQLKFAMYFHFPFEGLVGKNELIYYNEI